MHIGKAIAAVVLVLAAAVPARAEVQLRIRDGHVSLTATNATVREILAEWARVGQTRIVNGERVPGGPITVELNDVPEEDALEVILRAAAGYVAAPRPTTVANLSRFDRILVMPTSTPTRGSVAPTPPPAVPQPQLPPQFQEPSFPPGPGIDDEGGEEEEPAPNVVMPNARGPIFNAFPQPPQGQPTQAAPANPIGMPGAYPPVQGQAPVGVAVPGMVVPAPAQPSQPGAPPNEP
jgi:hypothetical protein